MAGSLCPAGRYFDEISQDTGKYCFGVEDTLKALEMGAVEILIVYENLDIMRYVLHCQGTEGTWCSGTLKGLRVEHLRCLTGRGFLEELPEEV